MGFEPINIFSWKIDPRGVLGVLRRLAEEVSVIGPDNDWETADARLPSGKTLTLGHDSEYYDGDNWPKQMIGMAGYFSRFPESENKSGVLQVIGSLRFCLSVPTEDLNIDSDDERLVLLDAVCQHLDGVYFTPSSLRDSSGRLLIDITGDYDPNAILPKLPPGSSSFCNPGFDVDGQGDAENDEDMDPQPPTLERVINRTLALTALAARATLEFDATQNDLPHPEEHRIRLLEWVAAMQIDEELEPDEWSVLQQPVTRLEQQDLINAMWRVEGLAVLAWALQLHPLPPDDELIIPTEIYQATGLFDEYARSTIYADAQLRSREELHDMQIHLLMLHWRLRDFSLRPQAMDFVAFSKKCWIGSFDVSTFRLVASDLAIGADAISHADENAVCTAQSIAMERHLAINWLLEGDGHKYSETDTST